MFQTREEARQAGSPQFFTGEECYKGHIALRRTSSGKCAECIKVNSQKYISKNKEKISNSRAVWNGNNKDKVRATNKTWVAKNKDSIAVKSKQWAGANKGKIRAACKLYQKNNKKLLASRTKEWKVNNPEAYASAVRNSRDNNPQKSANERARRRQAMPPWANDLEIKAVYLAAKLVKFMGINVHVDHIIPLTNNKVCGLHVHNNLQIISAAKNLAKSNKFYIDSRDPSKGVYGV